MIDAQWGVVLQLQVSDAGSICLNLTATEAVHNPNASVHVRGLRRKAVRSDLTELASRFGTVLKVVIWYGWGHGLVQMTSVRDADRMINSGPLVLKGRELVMGRGVGLREDQWRFESNDSSVWIEREVERCVKDMVLQLLKEEEKAALAAKAKARREARKELKRLKAQAKLEVREDLCWDFIKSGGHSCPRGDACQFTHKAAALSTLPLRDRSTSRRMRRVVMGGCCRWIKSNDTFKARRQMCKHKARINATIAAHANYLSNPEALVLDGPACHSVRSFLSSTRTSSHIYVPNNCASTYIEIQKQGVCKSFFGSLRGLLESRDTELRAVGSFGLVYLDYCCKLHAGKRQAERSPTADIELLFRLGLCDPDGCVLCVTLCKEDTEEGTQRALAQLVLLVQGCAHSAQGMQTRLLDHFSYRNNFAQIFKIGI